MSNLESSVLDMVITLAVLQVLDGWTTYQFLKRGVQEANGFVARLIGHVGKLYALLILKGGFAGFIVFLHTQGVWLTYPLVLLGIVCLYVGIVVWNLIALYGRRT